MELQTLTLRQLVADTLKYLQQQDYSKSTIGRYSCTWSQFLKYAKLNKLHYYTLEHGMRFLTQHYRVSFKSKNSQFHTHLIRSMRILYEIQEFGFIKSKRASEPIRQPAYLLEILEGYSKNLQEHALSYKTIRRQRDVIANFLLFTEDKGFTDLLNLTAKHIYDFLETRNSLALITKESELYIIRKFIHFLVSHHECKQELSKLFPVISVHSKDSIPSFFATDVIKKVLGFVELNSLFGKRDYAILLLAVQLGIRAGDIRNLKMEHIKWNERRIEFIQEKTDEFISLPLPQEILLALLDYLKNSRPQSEKTFIFIRMKAPYTEYADYNTFYYVVEKYLKAAKVEYKASKHHGLHSMRHSLAGNMLLDGTPMPVITNILGHKYADTTSKYLKIDITQLRQVGLEVPYDSKG